MLKSILSFIIILFVSSIFFPHALAAGVADCQPVYNGGPTCVKGDQLSINKTVKNPKSNAYVDNLGVTDPMYAPGQTVPFRITVKNMTNQSITNVTITDIFPQYLDFQKGTGKFDTTSRALSFTIDKLNADESKVFDVEGKIVSQDKLPDNKQDTCVINQARVALGKASSQDTSQVCLQSEASPTRSTPTPSPKPIPSKPQPTNPPTTKGGLPVYQPTQAKKTPPTGPEALSIIGLLPLGASGFFLRKFSNKKR